EARRWDHRASILDLIVASRDLPEQVRWVLLSRPGPHLTEVPGNRLHLLAEVLWMDVGAECAENFTSRNWVFRKIDVWLAEIGQRCFLLTGYPGTGKSAVLARLVQISLGSASAEGCPYLRPGFLDHHHFCRAQTDSTLSPSVRRGARQGAGQPGWAIP